MLTDYDKDLIARERRWTREKRLQRTGIPQRYWDLTWADYEPRECALDLRTELAGYADHFGTTIPPMHGGKGVLLQGLPGVGKTMAACILGVQLSDAGHYVRFIPLAQYMELLIQQIQLTDAWTRHENFTAYTEWEENREYLYALRHTAHLVILDDVGKEHHTSSRYAINCFDLVLRHRWNIGRPCVITSNLAPDEWSDVYSPAMGSFIYEAYDIYGIEDEDDMRRRKPGRKQP